MKRRHGGSSLSASGPTKNARVKTSVERKGTSDVAEEDDMHCLNIYKVQCVWVSRVSCAGLTTLQNNAPDFASLKDKYPAEFGQFVKPSAHGLSLDWKNPEAVRWARK